MGPAFVVSLALQGSLFTPCRTATCRLPQSPVTRPSVRRMRRTEAMVQKISTAPATSDALATFASFFSCMPGAWNSQRTYHYLSPGAAQTCEESQTTFDVERLDESQVTAVLLSNKAVFGDVSAAQGFRVSFLTRMASQEKLVRAGTNLAFVPEVVADGMVTGAYYRDVGYEEGGPTRARFLFSAETRQLQMTTWYSKVVSVDEIRLIHDRLRIRRIINYRRPTQAEMPLDDPMLIGYGVEVKGENKRLVE